MLSLLEMLLQIVCDADIKELSLNLSVNATVMNVALNKLSRDTAYRIGVAARTKVGTGVVSTMWPIEAKRKTYSVIDTQQLFR